MDYADTTERQTSNAFAGAASKQLLNSVVSKSFDRCISDAQIIREQVAECEKIASGILGRMAGPYPESCENDASKPALGGVLGELSAIQAATLGSLSDLRRTLENTGNHI